MNPIEELSLREEELLEQNIVWVFASPRSGTSWLSGKLLQHNTVVMNEPLIGSHLVDIRGISDKRLRQHEENASRESYIFCTQYKDVWKHFLRKLILNRVHAQFQDLSRRIVIKEPNGSVGADLLSEIFPRSRIVVLYRDGRDIINSQITALSKGGYAALEAAGFFEPLSGPRRRQSIHALCDQWNRIAVILETTYKQHETNLRYQLRYENLIADTQQHLRKLYDFINVEISDEKLEQITNQTSARNLPSHKKGIGTTVQFARSGAWKEGFDKEEQMIIQNLIGASLAKLGYRVE